MGTTFQGWDLVPENLDTVLVRPIVEDPTEKVDIGAFDRLLREEIVGHKSDAVQEFARNMRRIVQYNLWHILYDELDVFELLCKRNAEGTVGAADINKLPDAKIFPWKRMPYMTVLVPFSAVYESHSISESVGSGRIFVDPREGIVATFMGDRISLANHTSAIDSRSYSTTHDYYRVAWLFGSWPLNQGLDSLDKEPISPTRFSCSNVEGLP